jgi:hypothetical protein
MLVVSNQLAVSNQQRGNPNPQVQKSVPPQQAFPLSRKEPVVYAGDNDAEDAEDNDI